MDILSYLPDDIIHHIYSWMPTEQVVRTSILSKWWEGFWLSSPHLSFDTDLQTRRGEKFTEFVTQTLMFRGSCKVRTFRINLIMKRGYSKHLDLWIRYAFQNEVEELWLDLSGEDIFYAPRKLFYFSSSLTSLRLKTCSLWHTERVSWASLKTLVLEFVTFIGDVIHQVLFCCPQLESLELIHCARYGCLWIDSSSLKRLVITDSSMLIKYTNEVLLKISAKNIESICISGDLYRKCLLTDLSSLLHASLSFYGRLNRTKDFLDEQSRLFEVLESLEHVENLKLGEWCIKVLSIREKKGLRCRPLKCKCLILNTSLKQEDIPGILLLLKCSPDLETLTLNITSPEFEQFLYESDVGILADFCNFDGDHYLNSLVDEINCLHLKLKTIKINHFVDQNLVFPFIMFMLKEARVLKNMEMRTKYLDANCDLDSLFGVARRLSDAPKSSPNVVVKLHNSDEKVTLTIS